MSPVPRRNDRYRDATRAVAELRRGAAVMIRDGASALACAAAETVDLARLAELRDWTSPPMLLLRPVQNEGAGDSGVGLAIAAHRLAGWPQGIAVLRRLADPTLPPVRHGQAAVVPAGAEAAITLVKLARLLPTLVGAVASPDGLARAQAAGAIVADAADILALRLAAGRLVRVGEAEIPLQDAANARLVAFRNPESGAEHVAVLIGQPELDHPDQPAPLVRLHSECFTGDVLGSLRCDCGPQLRAAIRRMAEAGSGVVLYLAQEGRGIGLLNKLRSYVLQDRGLDTLDANAALGWGADERDYAPAVAMLRELGLARVRLLTNNPAKLAALSASGIAVERASLLMAPNGIDDFYLATKAARFGHLPD